MSNCRLKYKCVVLDHDDTVVETTRDIHYPSFLKSLSVLRTGMKIGFPEFMKKCFSPGFFAFLENDLKYSKEEVLYQEKIWKKDVLSVIPRAYDGIKNILVKIKQSDGIIAVVSHSVEEIILRDYKENFGILPDIVFGGNLPDDMRKPSPYPLEKIAEKYNLKPSNMVVVDDLKPGLDMAEAFGVDFYAAGWSHCDDTIKDYMKKHAKGYLENVSDLEKVLFETID